MEHLDSLELCRRSRYGIDLCLVDRDPISYSIKTRPACDDFIVTEENTAGERAEACSSTLPPYPVQKRKLKLDPVPDQPAAKKSRADICTVGSCEDESWKSADGQVCFRILRDSLPQDTLQAIIHLAGDAASVNDPRPTNQVFIDLTGTDGKDKRTAVHRCMRTAFPHLATRTDQKRNAIVVTADACFSGLRDAGFSAGDCFRILWFHHSFRHRQHSESSTSFLDVGAGCDRQSRGQMHAAIRRSFGGSLESKTQDGEAKCHLNPPILWPSDYPALFSDGGSNIISSNSYSNRQTVPCAACGGGDAGADHDTGSVVRQQFIQLRFRKTSYSRPQASSHEAGPLPAVYLHFVMEKTKLETLTAIKLLSKFLGNRVSDYSYAGTKDRHAITRQFMAVAGIRAEQLVALRDRLASKGIKTGSYSYLMSRLHLGDLRGNHFEVVVNNLAPSNTMQPDGSKTGASWLNGCAWTELQRRMDGLRLHGFLNYFGPQRFGASSLGPASHEVGLAMLRGNFELAVRLLLTPGRKSRNDLSGNATPSCGDDKHSDTDRALECADPPSSSSPDGLDSRSATCDVESHSAFAAKQYFLETGDARGALQQMPVRNTRECLLLSALVRFGDAEDCYRNALMALPHDSRSFYVHAYTSRLWNSCATFRLEHFGRQVCPGDIVHIHGQPGQASGGSNSTPSGAENENGKLYSVLLQEEQVAQHTLADVVIPILGHKGVDEACNLHQFIMKYLEKDELTLDAFKMSSLDLRLRGAVRNLLAVPGNLSISPFCWSQEGSSPDSSVEDSSCHEGTREQPEKGAMPSQNSDGLMGSGCSAAKLRFFLPPSTYATCLLYQLFGEAQ